MLSPEYLERTRPIPRRSWLSSCICRISDDCPPHTPFGIVHVSLHPIRNKKNIFKKYVRQRHVRIFINHCCNARRYPVWFEINTILKWNNVSFARKSDIVTLITQAICIEPGLCILIVHVGVDRANESPRNYTWQLTTIAVDTAVVDMQKH